MFGYRAVGSRQSAPISFGRVAYTILSIAIPMALSYTFSDTVVVAGDMAGHLPGDNQNNLAASALMMAMLTTLVSIAEATVFSMNIYTNDRRGQLEEKIKLIEDREENPLPTPEETREITTLRDEISGVLKAGIMLGLPSLPLPMIAMYFSKWLLSDVFGQDPYISEQAQSFLRPFTFAIPAISLLRMPFEQILFSFEKQKLVMSLALASFGVGSGFAYLFCFGSSSVPEMGLPGVAYGFLIESYLTAILFGAALCVDKTFKDFNFFRELFTSPYRNKDLLIVRELAQSGLPMLATTTSQVTAPFVINMLAGRLGTEALAAQSFSSWLAFGLVIPELALGQAVAQETNRRLGRAKKQLEDARAAGGDPGNEIYTNTSRVARGGLATAGLFITPLCIAVMAYPKLITDIVSNPDAADPNVIPIAQTAVRITATGIIFDTLGNTMVQTLRSLKDNAVPMGLSIGNLWVGVGMAYLLAFKTDLGIYGLGVGYVAGNVLGNIPLAWRFQSKTQLEALAALGDAPAPTASIETATIWCWRGISPLRRELNLQQRASSPTERHLLLTGGDTQQSLEVRG